VTIVYNAASSIDAYIVKNMLENEGIPSRVDGEHLQGGLGILPVLGMVTVSVEDEEDTDRALKIIKDWES